MRVCECGILMHVLIDLSHTLISVCVCVCVCVSIPCKPARQHERMHVSCDCMHALCAMLPCMGSNLNFQLCQPTVSTEWACIAEPPI